MNPDSFDNKLKQFSSLLTQEIPRINESVAMNAYALVRDRIINTGQKNDGSSLGSYSERELPLFFYTGKSLNKSGDAVVEKAKKAGKGLSYKDFREANNRPTDHVTTNFSGETWKDTGVVKQIVDGNKIVTVIGAKNTKVRKSGNRSVTTDEVLEGLGEQYGDILEVSPDEEKRIVHTYDVMLQQLIDKTFS